MAEKEPKVVPGPEEHGNLEEVMDTGEVESEDRDNGKQERFEVESNKGVEGTVQEAAVAESEQSESELGEDVAGAMETLETHQVLLGSYSELMKVQASEITKLKAHTKSKYERASVDQTADVAARVSGHLEELSALMGAISLLGQETQNVKAGEPETKYQKRKRELNLKKTTEMLEKCPLFQMETERNIEERLHETRRQKHLYFADRVFDVLLHFYGIKCPRTELEEIKQFKDKELLGRAVLGICLIYRDEWRELFDPVEKRIARYENFLCYCCMMPVEKYGPYFYSVLQRLAVIFEMALFAFENNSDFFEIAINCASYFFDTDFFASAGDWKKLFKAAEIVHTLTLPLQNALGCEKGHVNSFSDIITELVVTGALEVNSRQFQLFKDLGKLFEASAKDISKPGSSRDEALAGSTRKLSPASATRGWELLIAYFKDCYSDVVERRLSMEDVFWEKGVEYVHNLGPWLYSAPEEKKKSEVVEVDRLLHELDIDKETPVYARRPRKKPTAVAKLRRAADPVVVLKKETGAVQKRKPTTQRKVKKYVSVQTKYVENLRELYRKALPQFLRTYLHEYFVPEFEELSGLGDEHCFVIPFSLLTERKKKEMEKTCTQKRLFAKSPFGVSTEIPLDIMRKLDFHIVKGHYRALPFLPGSSQLYFVGEHFSSDPTESTNLWHVECCLDDVMDVEAEGRKAMKRFKKLIRGTRDCRNSTVEEDAERVRKFRMFAVPTDCPAVSIRKVEPKPEPEPEPRRKHRRKRRSKK